MKSGRSHLRLRYILIIVTCLCLIYYAINFIFGKVLQGFFFTDLAPSVIMLVLAALVIILPDYRPASKLKYRSYFCILGFICAAGAILINYGIGFMTGLGKSPYDHSITGIIKNVFYLGSMLAGLELSRSWLLRALFGKYPVLGTVIVGFIFTFFSFNPGKIDASSRNMELLRFIGATYFPALSENILASYLAILGGPLPAIVYRGSLLAYEWLFPVLPKFNWIVRSLTGTLLPVFGAIFVYQMYWVETHHRKHEKFSLIDLAGWFAVCAVSVLIFWFSLGVFSIYPNAILTGSMKPGIMPGDIVIVKRVTLDEIQKGDIIQFTSDGIRINHRVIDIKRDSMNRPVFITKGDANPAPDISPVYPEQIKGKIVFVVPKLGWPAVLLRSAET